MITKILNAIILLGKLHKHECAKTRNDSLELYNQVNRIILKVTNEEKIQVKYNIFDENIIVELSNFTIYDFLEKLLLRIDNSIEIKPKIGALVEIPKWKNQLKQDLIKLEAEKNYNHYLKHSKMNSIRFEIEYFDNIVIIRDKENILLTNVLTLKNALQHYI